MEIINNCPTRCRYCKLAKEEHDIMGGSSYECTVGVLEGKIHWNQKEDFKCDKFDPKVATAKHPQYGLAIYDLVRESLKSPWVDYDHKVMTCPECFGTDWIVEVDGIDWGEEQCKNCRRTTSFLSYSSILEYVDSHTFLSEWQGDNITAWDWDELQEQGPDNDAWKGIGF